MPQLDISRGNRNFFMTSPVIVERCEIYCREEIVEQMYKIHTYYIRTRSETDKRESTKKGSGCSFRCHESIDTKSKPSYFMKRKNPFKKYSRPKHPAPIPRNQKNFFLINAAMDESRMAIWRNMAARPNVPECV